MDVNIVRIQPSPFIIHSGADGPMVVSIGVGVPIRGSQLQFENRQPLGADIRVDGRQGDVVGVGLGDLSAGIVHRTVSFGVTLNQATTLSGAITGVVARVIDAAGAPLSPDFPFLTVTGAV